MRYLILVFLLLTAFNVYGELPFSPPKGWKKLKNPRENPSQIVYVHKGHYELHPSISLVIEPTNLPLAIYAEQVKKIVNSEQRRNYSSLGSFETTGGKANLSIIDELTPWGKVRSFQVTLIKEGQAYNLTATALQKEFDDYYCRFYKTLYSLNP
ncbi:MAG: hypothetical protein ACQEP8_02760 [Chlamydiota bacterium]